MERFWSIAPLASELVATTFSVISVSTPYWLENSSSDGSYNVGLWTLCVQIESGSQCDAINWGNQAPWINAVKALDLLSILGLIASLVWIYMTHTKGFKWTRFGVATAKLQALFVACGRLIFVKYVTKYSDLDYLSWSFSLGFAGVAFFLLAAIFFGIQGKKMRAANPE